MEEQKRRSHTNAKPTAATTWHLSPCCTDGTLSVWRFPTVRKLTRKLIRCAHPYLGISALLIFLVLLEMHVKGVNVESYKIT